VHSKAVLFDEKLAIAWLFFFLIPVGREHPTYAMSINTYSSQKLENLQLEHKEK